MNLTKRFALVALCVAGFAHLVHHTDAEREWAYDRTSSIVAWTRRSTKRRPNAGRL